VNLCKMVGQPQMTETREMGTQVDEGEQINLVATNDWEFGDYPIIYTIGTGESKPSGFVYPLHYVNVSGCNCIALEDSGCQIPVVSKRLFAQCRDVANINVGQVVLHGFGQSHAVHVPVPLVKLTVCMQSNNHDVAVEIPLVCAVTDISVTECDMILPADVVRKLRSPSSVDNVAGCTVSTVCDMGAEFGDPKAEKDMPEEVGSIPVSTEKADSTVLVSDVDPDVVVTPTPAVVSCDMHSVCMEENKKVVHLTSDDIQTTAEFVPHQMRQERVPNAFRPEFDQHISSYLVDTGLFHSLDSPRVNSVIG